MIPELNHSDRTKSNHLLDTHHMPNEELVCDGPGVGRAQIGVVRST